MSRRPSRRLTRLLLAFGGGIALLLLLAFTCGRQAAWELVDRKVRHDFPGVTPTGREPLARWLADPRRDPPVLLDVRTRAEYDVSHLPGAIRVEPGAAPASVNVPKDRPIVTYCSVGYRSAALAEQLRAAGFQDVVNLEGSIFRWANEGRPLERDGHPTDTVHPYNPTWAMLLQPARRAPIPPADGEK